MTIVWSNFEAFSLAPVTSWRLIQVLEFRTRNNTDHEHHLLVEKRGTFSDDFLLPTYHHDGR